MSGDGSCGDARPGLAYERTALAWTRTAMVMLIVAGLLARFADLIDNEYDNL